MSMCCGWAVSDSCSQGGVKDLSGENLQKLIETGQLYETLIFFTLLLHYGFFWWQWNVGDLHHTSKHAWVLQQLVDFCVCWY